MDDGRGWSSSPIENKDDKLSMSASDVYRELPYHLPRRVSQDGVPLVLASFDDSAVALSPANEDDETQLQVSTDSGWDKTQKLESAEPSRVDEVSDTETHIFSDDDDDMELTQIIADDDIDENTEAPREAQLCRPPRVGDAEDVGRGEATMRLLSPPPSAPFKRTAVHSESVHTYEPTQRLMEPPSASNETGASAAPSNQDPYSSNSIASSTTTMAHDASTGNVDHESSSVVHHQFLQHGASKPCDTVTSETRQSPRSHAMVIGAQPNDNQPQPAGIECPIEIPPRSSSSILSSTAADEASVMSTAVDDPPLPPPAVYLQRRAKDADAPLIHSSRPPPVVASTFDFDNNSNDSASQTGRPFAFLDQSQSQQDTQASLPDLTGLAATTLDAAMHVQGYTSHLTRQIMDDNNDDKNKLVNVFVTPPKPPRRLRSSTMISTPTTTTSSPPTCSRVKKRKMPTPDQPSPVPPRSAYATRVKCFADVHFYLSGFKEVASGQLVSQITSYGGKILKDIAQMKKVQGTYCISRYMLSI
ncbi:hypothetical protein DYB37_010817 [Aphanomyces astaci]|uniref:BRCT domain-containing protein n=1 Tax=Aphanomyces astaci TaxID=112090 RepID=A0A3R6XCE7_APHAT|nr:hypothetical protein DYB35_012727 [Aphanomyces astaci]RHZ17921.1 hypothetical protein DYB37_010817 [Aphanomyces astaci]